MMFKEIEILVGDARTLIERIPDRSVDLIFTDPPYQKEFLPLYGWLAEAATRVLKSSGFLLTYVGGYHKATVIEMLNRYLEYFWDYVEIHPGNSSVIYPRRTVARYKSILAYRLRGSQAVPVVGNVLGAFEGVGYDKRFHVWGQSANTARYLIECFTHPSDLVLDPFVGGGTTPFVCKHIQRRCIGFEVDPDVARVAMARLSGWQPQVVQQIQLPLWDDGH